MLNNRHRFYEREFKEYTHEAILKKLSCLY